SISSFLTVASFLRVAAPGVSAASFHAARIRPRIYDLARFALRVPGLRQDVRRSRHRAVPGVGRLLVFRRLPLSNATLSDRLSPPPPPPPPPGPCAPPPLAPPPAAGPPRGPPPAPPPAPPAAPSPSPRRSPSPGGGTSGSPPGARTPASSSTRSRSSLPATSA